MMSKKSFGKSFAMYLATAMSLAMPFAAGAVTVPANASLIDDCEGGSNENKFMQYWYCYDDAADGGTSTIDNYTKSVVAGKSSYVVAPIAGEGYLASACYRVDYTKGSKFAGTTAPGFNFVGIGTMLSAENTTINLANATKITFMAKAVPDANLNVEFATPDVKNFGYFHMTPLPSLTATWTKYTMFLVKGTGVVQPSWGMPALAALDLTKGEKVQWQLHWANNTQTSGKFWIDDVVITDYNFVYTPREACASCVHAVATQPSPSALFSNFETAPLNQHAAGLYWFCYNDAAGRNVGSETEFSDITAGALKDATDITAPPLIQIGPTGQGGGNAATIEYQLGPTYTEGTTAIKPFVGVGASLSDRNNTMFYNATNDNAKGVYFEYQCTGVPYLRFEVQTNQVFPNVGIVFHRLLPATVGTAWASATVMFDSLMLPNWAEVAVLPPSAKIPKLTELKQFQWAVQGAAGSIGKISIDNVYLVGATRVTPVGTGVLNPFSQTKLTAGITARLVGNMVMVDLSKAVRNAAGKIAVMDLRGSVVSQKNISEGKDGMLTMNLKNTAKGMYFLRVSMTGNKSVTVPISMF